MSERMGGRTEVLKAPIVETMGYLLLLREENEAKATKEEFERWLAFLSAVNAHPEVDQKNRKSFMEMIQPKIKRNDNPIPRYETDMALMDRLKAQQEGGLL